MNYYKDTQDKIFAFESDEEMKQICRHKGWQELTPITEAEKDELLKPTQEQLDKQRINEIDARLSQIDKQTERPTRAIKVAELKGVEPNQFDVDKLIALEDEAEQLRKERRGLVT